MTRGFWLALTALGVLWPAHAIASFDGVPFDRPLEAVVVALVLPALAWLAPSFVETTIARTLIVLLLAFRVVGAAAFTQAGLCAQFHLDAPLSGRIPKAALGAAQSIAVEAPDGILHSWDARADWRQRDLSDPTSNRERCSAIVTRAYPTQEDFPAWFLNLLRNVDPPRSDVTMRLTGFISTDGPGTLTFATGALPLTGTVGEVAAASREGQAAFDLAAGTHPIDLTLPLRTDTWQLVGAWNARDLWTSGLTTVARPSLLDRTMGHAYASVTTTLTAALVLVWAFYAWGAVAPGAMLAGWTAFTSLVLIAIAQQPNGVRFAALPLLFAPLVPVPKHLRNARGVFLLVGVAWLACFASWSMTQMGRFTLYSGDDWLTYQVAGYRIFMGGYWLEGGNAVFNYQPLYRWMSGGLHMLFGDSSVGEVYWDAACLLMGALLSCRLVQDRAGFRAGVSASTLTLATFSLGPIWYFVGRGLSEVAAAGWGFMAAFFLLRARSAGVGAAIAAGVCATLMFYTRLNHLIFIFLLGALLIPSSVPATARQALRALAALGRNRAAQGYWLVLACGLALFALRTWHYTGVFSLFEGTSLAINDTGLRLTTLGSTAVWQRVGHSLLALGWMNEPPRPDVRALLLVAGLVLALLAVCQVPRVKTLSIGVCLTLLGGAAAALLAHTHNYPGRMSIHVVPLAVALVVSSAARSKTVDEKAHQLLERTT